jgi:mannose/cellobiose epimerase-like protein (N-acyl-D-glucosamine 2-epimerase family)
MQYGGFVTNFDANGKPVEMPEKYLNTQCRMIWWFSQLNIMMPDNTFRHKAKQGVDFIIQNFWDERNGGWRWKVKEDGSQVDNGKIVSGHCYGSEYDGGRYCCTSICH